jgi:hypothetical protein
MCFHVLFSEEMWKILTNYIAKIYSRGEKNPINHKQIITWYYKARPFQEDEVVE